MNVVVNSLKNNNSRTSMNCLWTLRELLGFFNLNVSEKLQKLQNRAIRVITKSSYDTIVPDFFLARLDETIYWLEGLNKRLIECTSALIISSQLISVPAYHPVRSVRSQLRKNMIKSWDNRMESASLGSTSASQNFTKIIFTWSMLLHQKEGNLIHLLFWQ